jgi:hypothetical protein
VETGVASCAQCSGQQSTAGSELIAVGFIDLSYNAVRAKEAEQARKAA